MDITIVKEGAKCFAPSKNTIYYSVGKYPDGEPYVTIDCNLPLNINDLNVSIQINDFSEILELQLLCEIIERKISYNAKRLYIYYFPGARTDRTYDIKTNTALSLKVYSNIINSLNFQEVVIYDPHTFSIELCLNNCYIKDNSIEVYKALELLREEAEFDYLDYNLVCPDNGAKKKFNLLIKRLSGWENKNGLDMISEDVGFISFNKERIGHDIIFNGPYETEVVDKNYPTLVVDDICDGGGTFIGIAERLVEKGYNNLYLFVSHGIFSKGYDDLLKFYKRIFTTNSRQVEENEKVTVINIK